MIAPSRTCARCWLALLALLTLLILLAGSGAHAQTVAGKAGAVPAPLVMPPPDDDPFNNAAFSSQTVPTTMVAGTTYAVSVKMLNNGTTTWSPGAAYRLGALNPQDNTTWGGSRAAMAGTAAPRQTATFSFQVTAPGTPGTYLFQWQMLQEGVEWFGAASPGVAVTVTAASAPASAPTVTATRTPSPMTAGQPFTQTWSSANATSLMRVCTAAGTGYTTSDAPPTAGSSSGAASAGWVHYPSSCTWTATGPGGTATFNETMTTNAAQASGDTVTYIHTDGLGSPVARSDANGAEISRTRYEPYGATASGVTPTIGFTGHVNDADTGLVYMQQRYYDPVAGRFLSIDPVTTDASTGSGFNRYAYANNSPYKYLDPDGRNGVLVGVVTGGAVLMIGAWKYATDPQARAVINRIFTSIGSSSNASTAVGQGCRAFSKTKCNTFCCKVPPWQKSTNI